MLPAWLPPEWALLGGLLAVLQFATFSYWANSYWGGAVAAIGGALVVGALPRIKRSYRVRDAVLMGIGLIILANSRPYEGFLLSIPVSVVLFAWVLHRHGPPLRVRFSRVVLPPCLVLAVAAAGMGFYCWRVTGSPVRMPYQVERETCAVAPYFIWKSMGSQPPVYRSEMVRSLYATAEVGRYTLARTKLGFLYLTLQKLLWLWRFYIGVALSIPILMLPVVLPYGFSWRHLSEKSRFLLLVFVSSAVGWALCIYFEPHYAAPLTGVIFGLVLLAMRRLYSWQCWGKPAGVFMVRIIPAILVFSLFLRIAAGPLHLRLAEFDAPAFDQRAP